jgi:hypothetical protein
MKMATGILLLVFLGVSCSDRSEAQTEALYGISEQPMMSAAVPGLAASPAAPAGRSASKSEASAGRLPGAEAQAVDATAGRKLVYQASMDIEAADLAAAESFLDAAVQAAGGYVERRSADTSSIYMQVRVPVAALEGLMDALAGQGRTLGRSLNAEDVTDNYFDLEGRLRNKRLLEARYREYLSEAGTMDEILQVERSLSEVTTEIEWLEGSFRDLGKRIDLATLSVSIHTPYSADPSRPTLGQSMRRLLGGFGEALRIFLVILAGLVVYGIPAILALAGLWWLAFGRLGLLRRLFALAGRNKNRNRPDSVV